MKQCLQNFIQMKGLFADIPIYWITDFDEAEGHFHILDF